MVSQSSEEATAALTLRLHGRLGALGRPPVAIVIVGHGRVGSERDLKSRKSESVSARRGEGRGRDAWQRWASDGEREEKAGARRLVRDAYGGSWGGDGGGGF